MTLVGVAGDFFIKLAGQGEKFMEPKWFLLGVGLYTLSAIGWFFALKNLKLATVGVLYGVFTSILLVVVGVTYFKENLHPFEILGIAAGILSVALLARFA